ncbi:MAG: hypothetical protein Q9174_007131, partial [Haloplaca sp. 1 TL-2023]
SGFEVLLSILQRLGIPLHAGEPSSRPNTASSQTTTPAVVGIGAASQSLSQYSSISDASYLASNKFNAQHDSYLQGSLGKDGPSRFDMPISGWDSQRSMAYRPQSLGFPGARETVHNPSPVPFADSTLQSSSSDTGQISRGYGVSPPPPLGNMYTRPATAPHKLTELMPPPRDLPFATAASSTRSPDPLGLASWLMKDSAPPKATAKTGRARPTSSAKPKSRPASRQAKEKDLPLQAAQKPKEAATRPAPKRKAAKEVSPPRVPPPSPPQASAPASSKGKAKGRSVPSKKAPVQQQKLHELRSLDASQTSNDASAGLPLRRVEEPRVEQRSTFQPTSGNSPLQLPITNDTMSTDPAVDALAKGNGKGQEPPSEKIPIFPEKYAQFFGKITPEECQDRLDAWLRNYKNVPVPTAPAFVPVRHVLPAEEKEQMA